MDHTHTSISRPPPPDAGELPADPARVEDALRALGATLRSYRLYEGNGPLLERFIEQLRQKLAALWAELPELTLEIEERSIRWGGRPVYPTGDATGDLPFVFYKDGIRELTLLPGFEGSDLAGFLEVLARAPQLREDEDDLVTLLWERDLSSLRYRAVEVAADAPEPGAGEGGPPRPVSPQSVREAAAEPSPGLTPDDFQETLYFLDDAELRRLAEEVRRENQRDLWGGVLAALFDRLEDGRPDRQARIVALFGELLPSLLGAGQLGRAAGMLGDLVELAGRPGVFAGPVLRELRALFTRLANEHTIRQLAQVLEDSPAALLDDGLARLLGFFPPASIAPLMRAAETVGRPDVRRALDGAIQRLAAANRDQVTALLADADPAVAAAAARWVGRLGIGGALNQLLGLLRHAEPGVRVAAVESLQELRAAAAGKALEGALDDPEREVRIAAARALGALEYTAARGVLEAAVTSKRLRAADRSEKIAFFEAFGRLAGREGVALLDRTLNGRSWLGRGESTEIRACAALALARVRDPAARTALASAASDADPVVRSAVARALRGEPA